MNVEPTDPDPRRDEVAARVLLARLGEPGDVRLGERLRRQGAVQTVLQILRGDTAVAGLSTYQARLPVDTDVVALVAADIDRLQRVDAVLVLPGTSDWPTQLDDLGDAAPLLLSVRGAAHLRMSALRAVSIVGARASTQYGDLVAGELAAGLAERGWTVVSGGAFGIDAAAHRGAIAAGGPSVAVLAGGVDVAYPRAHEALFARLLDEGLLVAESPPGSAPHRSRFLVRNRVIAALTRGTVVVEAALRSGSLSTARHARDLGRVVMGVPGPVTSSMSAGVHRELREGALLVGSVEEIIEAVGGLGVDLAPRRSGRSRLRDDLDAVSIRVLDALPPRAGADAAAISCTAGIDLSTTMATLGLLELAGFVTRDRDGWRLAPQGRA
ncbi:MAG: DNA-processing protein DprA [Candidatus Nanopelagicales bacterium]